MIESAEATAYHFWKRETFFSDTPKYLPTKYLKSRVASVFEIGLHLGIFMFQRLGEILSTL